MLQLALLDAPNGTLYADLSTKARALKFTTNAHGFEALSAVIEMSLVDAFGLYDRPGLPHMVVVDQAADAIWEGRLEDVTLSDGGVELTALGYWRALSDVPYTGIWAWTPLAGDAASSLSAWRAVAPGELANREPAKYHMYTVPDATVGGLLMAPRTGESFGSAKGLGAWTWETPSESASKVAYVTFNYTLVGAAPWRMFVNSYTRAWGSGASEWTLDADGSTKTGTATITLANARDRLEFGFMYNDSNATFGDDTGSTWCRFGQISIKGTTSTVTSDLIVNALIAHVYAVNATQLSSDTKLVQAPGVTLTDELYDDQLPADILTKLAGLGDNQTPPRMWEVGVWEDRKLHFRPRGDAARAWYVDVTSLDVQRSLDTLWNAAYGVYQNANGGLQRTATATDADSIARWGLTRRAAVRAQTTSATLAGVIRDAYLDDRATPPARAGIAFRELYDAAGGRWPLWSARSGDTITIRNLPPTLSTDVDRIRTFRISRTEYDADADVLTVEPEEALPRLEFMLARRDEGL